MSNHSDSKSAVSNVFSNSKIPMPESITSCHSMQESTRLADLGPRPWPETHSAYRISGDEIEVRGTGSVFHIHTDSPHGETLDDEHSALRRLSLLELEPHRQKRAKSPLTPSEQTECTDQQGDGDDDLDLEEIASEALDRWFGINLKQLIRPIRIIDVFGHTKDECSVILQDEGVYSVDACGGRNNESDRGDDCDNSDEQRDHGSDGVGSSGPSSGASAQNTPSVGIEPGPSGSYISNGRDGAAPDENTCGEAQSTEHPLVDTTHRNKRQKPAQRLACPYRKRNPLTVKASNPDFVKCATTGFADISQLK